MHRGIAQQQLDIHQDQLAIQRESVKQRLSKKQNECLQSFRLTKSSEDATYEWYKDRVEDRVEGTCMWFLQHHHFQEWLKQESGPLLVSADPGCGKSVLAKHLIDEALPRSVTICYFFFKDPDQNTVRQALCAVLHQLFSQKPCLIRHAIKQFEKNGPGLVNSLKSLWAILADAGRDSQAGPIVIVLDALDECVKSEFEDLMRNLESQMRSNQLGYSKLKYFLTSRPYEQILSKFRGLLDAFPCIHIPGEEESETISQEISHVIQYRVERLAREKALSDSVKDHLASKLLKISHRTYLWVYLIFDHLKTEDFKKTPKGVRSSIETLPKNINQAYERILNQSKEHSVVKKVLSIILAAERPLTLSEMNVAVSMNKSVQTFQDLDLEEENDFKLRLRSWCGLFVSVHHGKIYFLHQTAREFLLANLTLPNIISKELQWQQSITVYQAHKILAELCVRYLGFFGLDTSPLAGSPPRASHNIDNRDFLDYAAIFWGVHFREACIENGDAVTVSDALRLCDPDSKAHSVWSDIFWSDRYYEKPRTTTNLTMAAYLGHSAVVRVLIERGANVNVYSEDYGIAVNAASAGGHEEIVKLLIDRGANVDAEGEDRGNVLQKVVKLLIGSDANVDVEGEDYCNTLQAIAQLLIDRAANGYVKDEDCDNINQEIAQLLDRGANFTTKGVAYGNALRTAAFKGYEAIVKLLIDNGANVHAEDEDYGIALHEASYHGQKAIVKLLIDNGVNINPESVDYVDALHSASSQGHEAIVKLLLDRGANVNALGEEYVNSLQAASSGGHEAIAKLLINKGANVNAKDNGFGNPLWAASCEGHEAIVKLLIDEGANVDAEDGPGALHIASYRGHETIVKLLIDKGADVNAEGGSFGNALQAALLGGHEVIVKMLINNGATPLV